MYQSVIIKILSQEALSKLKFRPKKRSENFRRLVFGRTSFVKNSLLSSSLTYILHIFTGIARESYGDHRIAQTATVERDQTLVRIRIHIRAQNRYK